MLGDIELFIVTWILAVIFMASLGIQNYASTTLLAYKVKGQVSEDVLSDIKWKEKSASDVLSNLRWSQKGASDVRTVSTILPISTSILGSIIGLANYLPVTEQNPQTIFFRTFSIPLVFFMILMTIFGVRMYMVHKALLTDLGEERAGL